MHNKQKPPNYSDIQETLSILKDRIKIFKAFIAVLPYPMTLWDTNGLLIYANNEAINLYKQPYTNNDAITWENHVLCKMGLPDPRIINVHDKIIIPAGENAKSITKMPPHFKNIQTVISSLPGKKNTPAIILITQIDNTRIQSATTKNSVLTKKLEELKITRKNIKKLFNEEIKNMQNKTVYGLVNMAIPIFQQLSEKNVLRNEDLGIFDEIINKINQYDEQKISYTKHNLTPAEIRVCEMLQSGLSGKEIAFKLNNSYATIHTHMNNIRKKFSLSGNNINLQSYLLEHYG